MIKIKKCTSIIAKTFFCIIAMPLGLNEDSDKKVFHRAIKMTLGTHCLLKSYYIV